MDFDAVELGDSHLPGERVRFSFRNVISNSFSFFADHVDTDAHTMHDPQKEPFDH